MKVLSDTCIVFSEYALVKTEEGVWVILDKQEKVLWYEPDSQNRTYQ